MHFNICPRQNYTSTLYLKIDLKNSLALRYQDNVNKNSLSTSSYWLAVKNVAIHPPRRYDLPLNATPEPLSGCTWLVVATPEPLSGCAG